MPSVRCLTQCGYRTMRLLDIFNLIAQVATAISVIVAVISIRAATKVSRRQMNVQVLITYSERYERIMESFPEGTFRLRFYDEQLPPESEQLTFSMLRYLNICSEEFYLWKAKYIDDQVWEVWEHELKRVLRSNLVMREWKKLKPEFLSHQEFLQFVEKVQGGASSSDGDI